MYPGLFFNSKTQKWEQMLETIDFTPTGSRSLLTEQVSKVLERQRANFTSDPIAYVTQLVSKERLSSIGDSDDENDDGKPNKYAWMNKILGFICFLMLVYFVKVMRPKSHVSKGGGRGKNDLGSLFGKGKNTFGSKGKGGLFGKGAGGRGGGSRGRRF